MSRFSRLEPLTYTEKNRLICRILNETNRKVELWDAFLDPDQSKPKNKSANLSHL
jgi:hypothetical protein